MVALAYEERQQERVSGEQRESIWSVSKSVKHVYFALFIGLFSAGTIWTVAQGVESVAALWHDLSSLAVTAAAVSMVITETGRYLMVLAAAFEEWREKRAAGADREGGAWHRCRVGRLERTTDAGRAAR